MPARDLLKAKKKLIHTERSGLKYIFCISCENSFFPTTPSVSNVSLFSMISFYLKVFGKKYFSPSLSFETTTIQTFQLGDKFWNNIHQVDKTRNDFRLFD